MQSHLPLQLPAFLFGTFTMVYRRASKEGKRCAEQYRESGALPAPLEYQEVTPGTTLLLHEVVDFLRDKPAWRLYMLGETPANLTRAFNWQNAFQLQDLYEAAVREKAWGALYYATGRMAPYDAACTARRLKAVLRSWDVLESARYLFSSPSVPLTLEELMMDARGWVPRAWSPETGGSFRSRLEVAAERMERATQDECIEAILRQVPHALALARKLQHPHVFADLGFWRERLATCTQEDFERISAARPSELISWMHEWDKRLETQ